MSEELFPEIQLATEALESRITITQAEVAQMKAAIAAKRVMLRSWRKALATVSPKRAGTKKRATPKQKADMVTGAAVS